MTSENLTIEQAQRMGAVVGRQLRYLGALTRRMDLRRFDPTDPLYLDAQKAYNAVHALKVRLHYLSCSWPWLSSPPAASSTAYYGVRNTRWRGHGIPWKCP